MRPSPAQRRLVRLAGEGAVAAQPDTRCTTATTTWSARRRPTAPSPSPGTTRPDRLAYVYDDDNVGNLLQETEPKGTLTADPDDYATTYCNDELNQVLEARDATLLVRTH
jgi:hypothetical protein